MHELVCDHGVWHIEQCPLQFDIQCFALQNNNIHYYMAKIVSTKIITGIHAPWYDGQSNLALEVPFVSLINFDFVMKIQTIVWETWEGII